MEDIRLKFDELENNIKKCNDKNELKKLYLKIVKLLNCELKPLITTIPDAGESMRPISEFGGNCYSYAFNLYQSRLSHICLSIWRRR